MNKSKTQHVHTFLDDYPEIKKTTCQHCLLKSCMFKNVKITEYKKIKINREKR